MAKKIESYETKLQSANEQLAEQKYLIDHIYTFMSQQFKGLTPHLQSVQRPSAPPHPPPEHPPPSQNPQLSNDSTDDFFNLC